MEPSSQSAKLRHIVQTLHELTLDLHIKCPKDLAWDCLVGRVSDWWPADFLCLTNSSGIQFEAFAGGRLYEESPEGGQVLWGTVAMILPGESIDLVGPVTAAFGGPSINFVHMSLTDNGDGMTQFKLKNDVLGNLTDEGRESVQEGWAYLYGAFKDFCERL